jgi:hypothetical protein
MFHGIELQGKYVIKYAQNVVHFYSTEYAGTNTYNTDGLDGKYKVGWLKMPRMLTFASPNPIKAVSASHTCTPLEFR